jgi:hypothetical protein
MRCFESYPMGSAWKHHVQKVSFIVQRGLRELFLRNSAFVAGNMNL